jgi:hypothetical protein
MFDGFRTDQLDVGDAAIFVRYGGDGPPQPTWPTLCEFWATSSSIWPATTEVEPLPCDWRSIR